MTPQFLDHIVILVKDLERTKNFYEAFLGTPSDIKDYHIAWEIGPTKIFFGLYGNENTPPFNKENIGLNHLAFGVRDVEELENFVAKLDRAQIKHSGIKTCPYSTREFIWFDDPDHMRLEFYLRP